MLQKLFVLLFIFVVQQPTFGQKQPYGEVLKVELSPNYSQWKQNYKLTKISYYKDRLVIEIRLQFDRGSNQWTKSIVFTPPNNLNTWCLKDSKTNEVFPLLEIRAIKHNNKLLKQRLFSPNDKVHVELSKEGASAEIFTCEAHFEALPSHTKMVDMLEGAESKFLEGHWNFFDINIHSFNKKAMEVVSAEVINIQDKEALQETASPSSDNLGPTQQPSLSSINDIECDKVLELSKIIFKDNSTKFENLTETERTLFLLKTYLQQHPKNKLILYGHTDVFGDNQRNMDLSLQRVEKLKQWFENQNISSTQLQAIALGASQPIFKEGNSLNRRVEVKIVCATQ